MVGFACLVLAVCLVYIAGFTEAFPWYGRVYLLIIQAPLMMFGSLILFGMADSDHKIKCLERFRSPKTGKRT